MVFGRQVWCAIDSEDEYLALSYAAFDEGENVWEIGGLMVAASARGKGLGLIMMRLPLGQTLMNERPLSSTPPAKIVAHVLAGNDDPRRIIPAAGFAFSHSVTIPNEALPGLRHDADGFIRGDEFHLELPQAVIDLADWCDSWDQKLRDGTPATVDLTDGLNLNDWARAFRKMLT